MTKYNKFWVAAIMVAVEFARARYGVNIGLDQSTATAIVGAVTALLVYRVPNA